MSNIRNILRKGHQKAKKLSKERLGEAAVRYAKGAIINAAFNYINDSKSESLTGNTVTGFSAGIYIDNKFVRCINVLDVYRMKQPTSNYTEVGGSGFKDYDSGEYVASVREYKEDFNLFFQSVTEGNSIEDTAKWLKEKGENYLSYKYDVAVIIANVSPYVNYLRDVRKLEILDATFQNARADFEKAVVRTKLVDLGMASLFE